MATSLLTLLKPLEFDQALQTMLAYFQKEGFPTSAWQDGGTDLTRVQADATMVVDFVTNQIPAIAGGSLLDYAPNYPGWTALTADQIFDLEQLSAVFTVGNVSAINVSGTSYSISPSNPLVIAFNASGKRYKSTGTFTIAPNTTTPLIQMQAEFAGASYVDPSNSGDISIVSPSMPGVSIANPSSGFTSVTHTGSGTGTTVPSGSPALAHTVVISINATSDATPANVSYAVDGQPAVNAGAVSSLSNIGGTGINIAFNNGASGVSWAEGDTYEFQTPASWITSQGADAQSDISLADDCRNRWASLSAAPTENLYVLLAKRTPTVGAQVTQAFVVPDAVVNNKVNIVIAGPGGVLPSTTIQTIQDYITPWARGTDIPVVQSPSTTPVTITAAIVALASLITSVQTAVQTAILDYIASISVNGTVEIGEIIAIIRPITGVRRIDVSSVTINGVADDLELGSPTTFVLPAYPPTLALTWSTVTS